MDKKINKRKQIVLDSYDYLVKTGIKNFSLNGLLKDLSIAKGTLYHYFKSKDEIIFEIFTQITKQYIEDSSKKLLEENTLEGKLEVIFEIYLVDNKKNNDALNLYRELMNVSDFMNHKTLEDSNLEYITYMQDSLIRVFKEEIENKNIKKEALDFINTFIATADGMLFYSYTLKNFNLQNEYSLFLKNFIKLVRIEK